ncbi:MAG: DUF6663 family protein [Halobacteriales archaeon]
MEPTTAGRFRVLDSPREPDELLLLDVEGYDPTYVPRTGHGDLDGRVAALRPGYLVGATLAWDGGTPRVVELEVRKRTLFEFVDGVTGIFEAAREAWRAAAAEGAAMNSRVTRDTAGDPNGVVYVFAQQDGARDLFAEFADGARPLEPLIERVNESRDGDREVFVLRPADEPFLVVYIVFEKGGLLADTVRDTYGCPRPAGAR